MLDFENPKTKRRFTLSLIAIAIAMVIIIFYDRFASFYQVVDNVLSVLNSIFVGIVIAYLLNPLERFFSRVALKKMKAGKWHKFLSILFTYLTVIGFITVFLLITLPQLFKSIAELPDMLHVFIVDFTKITDGWIDSIESSEFYQSIMSSTGNNGLNLRDMLSSLLERFGSLEDNLKNLASMSISIIGNIYSFVADLLIGFILSIYLLAAKSRLGAQGKMITTAILGQPKAKKFLRLVKFSDRTFGSFIQGKIINSIITAILTFFVFSIFGLPYPQLLSVIIGVTDIIPVFGPFLGGIPCGFLVLIAAPEKLLLYVILLVVLQQIDGNYIAPKILGESTGLSALGVFVAIIVMGGYFGLGGMIIGVPLFAVIFALVKTSVEKKLAARGLSTDIVDYYYRHSDDLPEEEHHSYFKKIVDLIINAFKKLASFVVKIFSGKSKKDSKKAEKATKSNGKDEESKSNKK